jgi:hypothetical protein
LDLLEVLLDVPLLLLEVLLELVFAAAAAAAVVIDLMSLNVLAG